MFSNVDRCIYRSNQLASVICQLRFPEILTIGANLPVAFQESIRGEFPLYSTRQEFPAPKLSGVPGNLNVQKQEPVTNYQFTSADNAWTINLTSKFISLSCSEYTRWEDFARMMDKPLASFIKLYQPAYFERVGLRYLNAISRKKLDLEDTPWKELLQPQYLGLLVSEDVPERAFSRCTQDVECAIPGGCYMKLHVGPGMVKRGNDDSDKEVKLIFDLDVSMSGNVPVNLSAASMQTVHTQAGSIFRDAITDALHEAML